MNENDAYGQSKKVSALKEELEGQLTEKQKELLKTFIGAKELHANYFCHDMNARVLDLGVQIGMELQHSFDNWEE